MPDPINYLGLQQTQSPMESLLNGLKVGSALNQARQESHAADLAKQYGQDVQAALASGKASDFAALSAKYPQQREAFKQSYDMLHKDQQNSEFGAGVQVFNALNNGNPDAANAVLDQHIAALENSGQDASDLKGIKSQIASNPNAAKGVIGLYLSSVDPDRWSKIATEQRASEAAPYELTEKQANAHNAAVKAKYAESQAAQDLTKGGWDIAKLQNDIQISKLNSQIAAMNAQTSRETNELKRQELQQKVIDAQQKRDQATRDVASNVESFTSQLDNSLNTIDRLLKNPGLKDVIGPLEGREYYPSTFAGSLNPFSSSQEERTNALADINTVKAQTFIDSLKGLKEASKNGASGLGSTTEKEMDMLINATQSLDPKQGEKQFTDNLKKLQEIALKARNRIGDKYGVPTMLPERPNATQNAPGTPQGFRVLGVEGQ